jgi:hypothetical protein
MMPSSWVAAPPVSVRPSSWAAAAEGAKAAFAINTELQDEERD